MAYLTGEFLGGHADLSPILVALLAMGIGAVMGAINGVLVAHGRVPSIIVTLGTLALYRSFLVQYSDARTITTASLPHWLVDLPQVDALTVFGLEVRVTVVLAVCAALVMGLALTRLRAARSLRRLGARKGAQ